MIARLDDRPIRVFVDANVLFSGAIGGRVSEIWGLAGVVVVTSEYAVKEAWENLDKWVRPAEARAALADVLTRTEVVSVDEGETPALGVALSDPADVPILTGAIVTGCEYLVTGDRRCFGALFGRSVMGVLIQTPAQFLVGRRADG